jgi:hypothetical protein
MILLGGFTSLFRLGSPIGSSTYFSHGESGAFRGDQRAGNILLGFIPANIAGMVSGLASWAEKSWSSSSRTSRLFFEYGKKVGTWGTFRPGNRFDFRLDSPPPVPPAIAFLPFIEKNEKWDGSWSFYFVSLLSAHKQGGTNLIGIWEHVIRTIVSSRIPTLPHQNCFPIITPLPPHIVPDSHQYQGDKPKQSNDSADSSTDRNSFITTGIDRHSTLSSSPGIGR